MSEERCFAGHAELVKGCEACAFTAEATRMTPSNAKGDAVEAVARAIVRVRLSFIKEEDALNRCVDKDWPLYVIDAEAAIEAMK